MMYVDTDTMEVCTAQFLTGRKRPGLVVKNLTAYPLTDEDLTRLGAARLDESATGDFATGSAVPGGTGYFREYRAFNAEELERQADASKKALKLAGVEFEGIMCSAMKEDMWGLTSVKDYVVAGGSAAFKFENGNTLTLTTANYAAFEAVWTPFRASFF